MSASAETPRRGPFITFEGGDGVGKSTQIVRLAEKLRDVGCEVVTTREPGGSAGAETIRELLVTGDAERWSPITEALLMFAARADHLEKTINPARERGAAVLCDRFADSTMAYQGAAGALGAEAVAALTRLVVGEDGPDLTIILDAPVDVGLARAGDRGGDNRFESKGRDYQARVRQAFLDIAAGAPERCVVISATRSAEAVALEVAKVVRQRFQIG